MIRQRDSGSITVFFGRSVSSTRVNGYRHAIPLLIERLFRRDAETNTPDAVFPYGLGGSPGFAAVPGTGGAPPVAGAPPGISSSGAARISGAVKDSG
jgi:hypothetical protein